MSNSITTVIIDTETYELGLRALNNTVLKFPTDRVLIYSDDPEKWPGYSVKLTPKLVSIEDYNRIVMKDLADDLETDRALIIQHDGFVINPQEFSSHFLYYDYIGAPWIDAPGFEVGNGGFSLRSKRLVCSAAAYYEQKAEDPEDVFICRLLRPRLELKHGCEFAPVGIAKHFSTEFEFHRWPTFGFHGLVMLPFVYRNDIEFLLDHLPIRCFAGPKGAQLQQYFIRAPEHERLQFLRKVADLKIG